MNLGRHCIELLIPIKFSYPDYRENMTQEREFETRGAEGEVRSRWRFVPSRQGLSQKHRRCSSAAIGEKEEKAWKGMGLERTIQVAKISHVCNYLAKSGYCTINVVTE